MSEERIKKFVTALTILKGVLSRMHSQTASLRLCKRSRPRKKPVDVNVKRRTQGTLMFSRCLPDGEQATRH